MAENRVSQLVVQVSASGSTEPTKARVSQLVAQLSASGSAEPTKARVSQLVVQISVPVYLKQLTGNSGLGSSLVFGSGGAVTLDAGGSPQTLTGSAGLASQLAFSAGQIDLWLLGSTGLASQLAFGSGASVVGPITGNSGLASSLTFGTGGSVTGPLVGSTGLASSLAFGSDGLVSDNTVAGTVGMESQLAFGADGSVGWVGGPLEGIAGLASQLAFGTGIVAGPISGSAGIGSSLAFGTTGSLGIRLVGTSGLPSQLQISTQGFLHRGIAGSFGLSSQLAFGQTGSVLSLTNLESNFAVYVAGINRTAYLQVGTVRIDRQLNFYASANFFLLDEAGIFHPTIGQRVEIWFYDEDTGTWSKEFGGSVEAASPHKVPYQDALFYEISCIDYGRSLGRRLLNKRYTAGSYGTFESILKDISDRVLTAEGIQWNNTGDPGVTFGDVEFAYEPINAVLDRLAQLSGWSWQVDFDRVLQFSSTPCLSETAPFNLTETDGYWRNIQVRHDRGLYCNKVYVNSPAFPATTTMVEKTYTVPTNTIPPESPYNVYYDGVLLVDREWFGRLKKIHSVKLNGTDITWYLQQYTPGDPYWQSGMETGTTPPNGWRMQQIYAYDLQLIWNIGDPVIFAEAPTGVGNELTVKFEVMNEAPLPVVLENATEIAARRAVEGGTGIYESMVEYSEQADRETVLAFAEQYLARFAEMGLEASGQTDRVGLEPGQEITVDLPGLNAASTSCTIERLTKTEESARILRTDIVASNAIQQRDALTAMKRLIARIKKTPVRVTDRYTFVLAQTIPGITNPGLIAGTDLTNTLIVRKPFTCKEVVIYAKTAPTGCDATFIIKANGVEIASGGFSFPSGGTEQVVHSNFVNNPQTLTTGTLLTIDCAAAGSLEPGKDFTVVLIGWV